MVSVTGEVTALTAPAGPGDQDPNGEFLSALGAEPVYQLFGHKFGAVKQPPVDQPVHGRIGYHVRTGKHDVTPEDWAFYLAFAKRHLGEDLR